MSDFFNELEALFGDESDETLSVLGLPVEENLDLKNLIHRGYGMSTLNWTKIIRAVA